VLARAAGGEGTQQLVGLRQRPAAHDGQRSAQLTVELRQEVGKAQRHHDLLRRRRDFDERAVEIEEQRRFPVEMRRYHPEPPMRR